MKLSVKKIGKLLLVCFMVFPVSSIVTGQAITYAYDNNGNRIDRNIVTLKSGHVSPADTTKEFQEEILGEMSLKIYPNPTQGEVTIDVTGIQNDAILEYRLFNPSGVLLEHKKEVSGYFSIDLLNYPSGIYILRLLIADKKSEWKIIKQ